MGKKGENGELSDAAQVGDIEFLREKVSKESKDYFLASWLKSQNILHLSAYKQQVEFFKEAMKLLPKDTILELLSAQDVDGWTPLHFAAGRRNLELVQSIVAFYKKEDEDEEQRQQPQPQPQPQPQYSKPWLCGLVSNNRLPLNLSLPDAADVGKNMQNIDDCALEIASLDIDFFCTQSRSLSATGESLLFYAIKYGLSRLVQYILNSSSSYDVTGLDGFTPLHYAPLCSGEVLELLLQRHSDMIDKSSNRDGYSVLHKWAMMEKSFSTEKLSKFPEIRTRLFRDAIFWQDKYGCNALHRAAANSVNYEIALILIQGYQDVIAAARKKEKEKEILEEADREEIEPADSTTPWRKQDKDGNTPLYYALKSKNEKLAAHILSLDPTLRDISNHAGESPLYVAVASGCDLFINDILKKHHPPFKMLRRFDGTTVLHNLHNIKDKTGRTLLEKFWWMMNLQDDKGSTALDEAKTNQCPWLVNLLRNPSLLKKEPFDWIQACKNKDEDAVRAFIDNCQDLRMICRKKKDTPLHHIKLQTHQEYLELLKIPSINDIKNLPNSKNQTPLYRALVEEDINLAKALLTDKDVDWQKSAMKRLQKLYLHDENWKEMCDQIKVNPTLTTGYIQPGTNLGDMRTTLSVVAALLATITFAAGFTLPGGLNSDTGDAILAKKAAFIVFLLADVYAMCTSMLVLLCLIWSMASPLDMSYVLVDRSVFILMQAVYGTMVAFMTGIYLVIARSSLWTAIVIFVMCSVLVLSASIKSVLHILIKLIPAANQGGKDILQELEEGRASTSKNKES